MGEASGQAVKQEGCIPAILRNGINNPPPSPAEGTIPRFSCTPTSYPNSPLLDRSRPEAPRHALTYPPATIKQSCPNCLTSLPQVLHLCVCARQQAGRRHRRPGGLQPAALPAGGLPAAGAGGGGGTAPAGSEATFVISEFALKVFEIIADHVLGRVLTMISDLDALKHIKILT